MAEEKVNVNEQQEEVQNNSVEEQQPKAEEKQVKPKDENVLKVVGDIVEEETYDESEYEELKNVYEKSFKSVKEGEIVKGKIVQITNKEVVVDIGFKAEGIIPIEEFNEPEKLEVGQEVDVFLDSIETQEGILSLSKKKADFYLVWDQLKKDYEEGNVIDGYVAKRIKGGMVVKIYGVEAFLPGSQIDIKQVTNFNEWVGQTIPVKIIKINKARRNIVVSRRAVLEESREKKRQELLKTLEKGMVVEGVVKNITDFGVFIDLGGVDGLLHITDMSWGRINHPTELIKKDERIKVKIIDYDKNKQRVSLGLKQLEPHPWEKVEEKYRIGTKVKGKVVNITDYGAFVELEKGIEGLIHISEMSWTQHVKHPSEVLKIGDEVEAVVLSVNKDEQKISLGLKQATPDPWEVAVEKYPVGTKLKGVIKNLTNFGVFIEMEDGVEGLVHISDISWSKRIRHPNEILKKGQEVEVVVLGIDKENRRISLGMKQVHEDPWKVHIDKYKPDVETIGKIRKVLEKGLVVDLDYDFEGFVPVSQIYIGPIKRTNDFFKEGMEIPLKVMEVNKDERRIVLSFREYFNARPRKDFDDFMAAHKDNHDTKSN